MQATTLRGSSLRSRPFYATVFLLSLLTAYSFLVRTQQKHLEDRHDTAAESLLKRGDEPECSGIREARDQCAFAKQYCTGDDAGLLPYLQLYYCTISRARPVAFVLLVIWLGLLFTTIGIAASDFFSINLSTIATILGLSESLAGVTFLAFGNGSPDVFSTFAAMSSNSPGMAVGELIGAASFITCVVAGSMALVREFRVDRKTYARDIVFFIVAVGFTMAFLADGKLRFWECWVMVGYYILYVLTVVSWHWYTTRRRRRLRREGEARSHFYGIGGPSGDELAGEPYRDDQDDVDQVPGQSPGNGSAHGDALALEMSLRLEGDGRTLQAETDSTQDDEDHERMVAAEVTRSMRVLRTGVKRHHNMNPIRPSLVGALEFRSALAQLQRESNLQLSSISGRSYSDDFLDARFRRGTTSAVPDSLSDASRDADSAQGATAARRDRALSSGDMPISSAAILKLVNDEEHGKPGSPVQLPGQKGPTRTPPYTIGGNLAPPPAGPAGMTGGSWKDDDQGQGWASPRPQPQIQSRRSSYSETSSPSTPFPGYIDSPMVNTANAHSEEVPHAPPAAVRRDGYFPDVPVPVRVPRPVRWWPYSVLPPPHVMLATLFPTLQGWREKNHWDRFLSTILVPSILLLVITLPVVDSETNEGTSMGETVVSHRGVGQTAPTISVGPRVVEAEGERERYQRHTPSRGSSRQSVANIPPSLVSLRREETAAEPTTAVASGQLLVPAKPASDKPASGLPWVSNANDETLSWNRWLVCLQLFTGPLFSVVVLWANLSEDLEQPGRELVRMVLYTLVVSLVLIGILLLTTTEHKRPRFHNLLCFLGFMISIAWISTIAGEVVGLLKAFGAILGISEALLGLTIFAAGNSIGDLVADITVARLGYPVMALSACFGGPMLNILLGIGIGGVMMMIKQAKRKQAKHPEQPMQYGPYRVEVGGTLLISSITLLTVLVLLLIVVPMNRWILSRKIGWGLIALWVMSTVVNVVVEVTGIWTGVA